MITVGGTCIWTAGSTSAVACQVVVNLLSLTEQGAGFVAVSSIDNLWVNR